MKISVIVPCYNARETIGAQLHALSRQRWSEAWEVLVVDNRSTDGSMDVVMQYQDKLPGLRIINAHERQGQPFALNTGAAAAAGQALLFCDADDEVGEGYIAAMGAALSEHNFVACAFDVTKLNADWVQMSHANLQQNGLSEYRYPPYLPHSGGGALGVTSALFDKFGGFDETLPILHDTDFCWRLQLEGVPLTFVRGAVTHVRYRDSLRGLYRQSRGYAEYNVLLYKRYRRHGMPEISPTMRARAWANSVRHPKVLSTRVGRAQMAWKWGWCMGRLRGSIKHRVLAL